jgi:hypothetical protein
LKAGEQDQCSAGRFSETSYTVADEHDYGKSEFGYESEHQHLGRKAVADSISWRDDHVPY